MSNNHVPTKRAFKQMDVFTSIPYLGNPLAVILDGNGLSTEQMQSCANWLNLSETTFILPPTNPKAHYRVKIFTTTRELPFAGHPTLGTCKAFIDSKPSESLKDLLKESNNKIIQECGIGLISISLDSITSRLSFSAPSFLKTGKVSRKILKKACNSLGLRIEEILDSNWIDNGPGWFLMILKDEKSVKKLNFNPSNWKIDREDDDHGDQFEENQDDKEDGLNGGFFGVVGPYGKGKKIFVEKGLISKDAELKTNEEPKESDPDFELRAFVVDEKIEDPVTGSFNAGVAKYLISKGLAPSSYIASQGTNLGRNGRIFVNKVEEKNENGDEIIWIGGDVVTCIEGQILI